MSRFYPLFLISLLSFSACNQTAETESRRTSSQATVGQFKTVKKDAKNSTTARGLYDRNTLSDITTDIITYSTSTRPGLSGGSNACSEHTGRHPGDPCAYDFCGDDAANAHLSAAVYTTVKALKVNLKAQGKFPNPCTNAGVINVLKNLQTLDLSGQSLKDISPLMTMTQLTNLNLNNNQITDLSALSGMTVLKVLNANSNQLSYLTGLSTDQALVELYVANNQIQSIDPIVPLKNLTTVDISNNKVDSIIPLTLDHKITINILGNTGILTESKVFPRGPDNGDDNSCFIKMSSLTDFSNINSNFKCFLNNASLTSVTLGAAIK